MIWAIIPGPIKRAVAWLLAGLGAVWAIRASAKREARQMSALEVAARYRKTSERIDNADLGLGATDQQRIKRLRDFAGKP